MEKTIYRKDSKGNIRFLKINTDNADLIQTSGILGTNSPVEHRRTCKGKNIGKSNETTPKTQACNELENLVTRKLKKDYFNTIKEAEESSCILPMLAKDYKEVGYDWKEFAFIQPKLDGMRCLLIVEDGKATLMSREGINIMEAHNGSMKHIVEEVEQRMKEESCILDGELYCHGNNFQENMEMIKKYTPGTSENVKFHCYDCVEIIPFYQRFLLFSTYIETYKFKTIEVVETSPVTSEEEVKVLHDEFVEAGYEGAIIRSSTGLYAVNKRSSDLLKYKNFKDIACKIVEIGPADKKPTWGRPVVEWNGKQFACNTKMSHKKREELLTNKHLYIGKTAEVRYFEEYDSGIPRFPVMHGIRLDK